MLDSTTKLLCITYALLFIASAARGFYHYERQSIFDKDRAVKYLYFCGFLYVVGVGVVSALGGQANA